MKRRMKIREKRREQRVVSPLMPDRPRKLEARVHPNNTVVVSHPDDNSFDVSRRKLCTRAQRLRLAEGWHSSTRKQSRTEVIPGFLCLLNDIGAFPLRAPLKRRRTRNYKSSHDALCTSISIRTYVPMCIFPRYFVPSRQIIIISP